MHTTQPQNVHTAIASCTTALSAFTTIVVQGTVGTATGAALNRVPQLNVVCVMM